MRRVTPGHANDVPRAADAVRTADRARHRLRASGLPQLWRLLCLGLQVLPDATLGSLTDHWVPAPRRAARRERRTARVARHVAATLGTLRGPWVKAGQFAALRHDLLPPGATAALATLRDRVPPLAVEALHEVVESELGRPIGQAFTSFEREPLGAASLAQVHRATLADGTPVAVKVQVPWLRHSLPVDLRLLRVLLGRLARGRAAGIDLDRAFDEFTAGLAEELDFRREARIAAEISEASQTGDLVVPETLPALSTARVLTMRWLPALPLSDPAGLAARSVALERALEVLARALARQVFERGLFHADPHAGNVFVLDEARASDRPRVLLIDFGLAQRLDASLRRELRQALLALLQRDAASLLAGMDRLGMIAPGAHAGVEAAVEIMLARLAGEGAPLALGPGRVLVLKDEAKRLLQDTPGLQLPTELLLVARTFSTLFALCHELAPDFDPMPAMTPSLLRFLAERDDAT